MTIRKWLVCVGIAASVGYISYSTPHRELDRGGLFLENSVIDEGRAKYVIGRSLSRNYISYYANFKDWDNAVADSFLDGN